MKKINKLQDTYEEEGGLTLDEWEDLKNLQYSLYDHLPQRQFDDDYNAHGPNPEPTC